LNVVWGYAGQMSFAQLGLGAVGAYTFTIFTVHRGVTPILAALLGVLFACAASLILSVAALRLRDFHFAILTVSFSLVILAVVANWELAGRTAGLLVPRTLLPTIDLFGMKWNIGARNGGFYALVAIVFVLANAFAVYIARSRGGGAMRAVRDDELLSRSVGMNTLHVKTVAFLASAVIAALAGILQAVSFNLVVPELFSLQQTLLAVMLIVLVGRGGVYAPVIAAVIYVVLYNVLPIEGSLRGGILGAIVVFMIVFFPSGLAGITASLRYRLRKARRPNDREVLVVEGGTSPSADHDGLADAAPTTSQRTS
jgi:branched-chain amino acid transport system permease protein